MANEQRLDLIDRRKVYENACAGCIRHGEKPGECYHDEPCEHLMFEFTVAEPVDAVEVKCKVGDWVYALWEAPVKQKYIVYCAEVKEIRIGMRNCRLTTTYRLEPIMYRGHIHEYRDEDFGKLVFPSEDEAQSALAKMDGGDEGV